MYFCGLVVHLLFSRYSNINNIFLIFCFFRIFTANFVVFLQYELCISIFDSSNYSVYSIDKYELVKTFLLKKQIWQ